MSEKKPGLFTGPDGKNLAFTFFLVATLFLLWAVLNSMIDTMDKHFQNLLGLTKSQSAWVQFAHYFGYTLMALPAGLMTRKIGYKGGIILGLLLVSFGGFWFVPATYIAQFWGFLLGVCLVAMGLTVLETVANPYTTVLGPKETATFRINLAQVFNGFGWIIGPFIASKFFYATTGGAEAASKTLYIPYLITAVFVLVLAVLFWRANLPEIKVEDEYQTDTPASGAEGGRIAHRGLAFFIMLAGAGVLVFSVYAIAVFVMEANVQGWVFLAPLVLAAVLLWNYSQKLTTHSIWAHPHFSGATIAQFAYVAAQAGIFSFFINYMTEIPSVSETLRGNGLVKWITEDAYVQHDGIWRLADGAASRVLSVGFFLFFMGRIIGAILLSKASAHRVLGTYAVINFLLCLLVALKIPTISVMAVFGTFFFMSLMFPTIFSLGIHGLGPDSKKKASAFIVMSITGGALMPKVMGRLGDLYDMSYAFLMPMGCFILIALYGFFWSKLSKSEGVRGLKSTGGH